MLNMIEEKLKRRTKKESQLEFRAGEKVVILGFDGDLPREGVFKRYSINSKSWCVCETETSVNEFIMEGQLRKKIIK